MSSGQRKWNWTFRRDPVADTNGAPRHSRHTDTATGNVRQVLLRSLDSAHRDVVVVAACCCCCGWLCFNLVDCEAERGTNDALVLIRSRSRICTCVTMCVCVCVHINIHKYICMSTYRIAARRQRCAAATAITSATVSSSVGRGNSASLLLLGLCRFWFRFWDSSYSQT